MCFLLGLLASPRKAKTNAMENQRREFLKNITLGGFGAAVTPANLFDEEKIITKPSNLSRLDKKYERKFNALYEGSYLNRIAFPIGGIGTGMYCIEGTGAISHMSIRHRPEIFHEPGMFAAITIKGAQTKAKVLSENPDVKVKIVGHTDSDGDDKSNLDLSKRRADAVKSALAKDFSIDAARLETDGKGESQPADKNNTETGKANNRRVEFIKL